MNVLLLFLASMTVGVSAHMAMVSPCPRYHPRGEDCPALPSGASLDYSMTTPLGYQQPLCKHTAPWSSPAAIWAAGERVTVKFPPGGAPHGGGHCEFSLSYDGGKTFVVVHQELGKCFFSASGGDVRTFSFVLPANIPGSRKVVFAWTWVNAVGNREFYMNCADVVIKGRAGSYTGKAMTVLNHSGYPTIPEFGGNPKTGLQYYDSARTVAVTSTGA